MKARPSLLGRWLYERGDTYVLGFARALIGIFLFWLALRTAQDLTTTGYFGDHFHMPFLPEALVPSRAVFTFICAVRLLLAATVTVGHRARFSLLASALLGVYVLLC